MKDNTFTPRADQSFDIPPKVRVSLYVASEDLDYEFEPPVFDNLLLKSIAEGSLSKHARSQLIDAKLNGLLSFELVEPEVYIKPLTTYMEFLALDEAARSTIVEAHSMIHVTAVEPLDGSLAVSNLVHYTAALLAREFNGLVLEPYALRVYASSDQMLAELDFDKVGPASIKPFVNIIQSQGKGQRYRTTTHGLARFGLPEFLIRETEADCGPALYHLVRGLTQSFFENVMLEKQRGEPRYSFASPLQVSSEQMQNGKDLALPLTGQGKSQAVPLIFHRSLAESTIDLAFRGRREEKDASLRAVLSEFSLI